MRRTRTAAPVDYIQLDDLLNLLTALNSARPDLAEGLHLVAEATGLGDCFELDQTEARPMILIERPRQLSEGVQR